MRRFLIGVVVVLVFVVGVAHLSTHDAAWQTASRRIDHIGSGLSPINGRVVDAAGRPVGGARIVAVPADPERTEFAAPAGSIPDGARFATSDSEGAFACDVQAAWSDLFVDRQGFGRVTRTDVPAGETVTIQLFAPLTLAGRIIDRDGRPISKASVSWNHSAAGIRTTTSTVAADDGTYRVAGSVEGADPVRAWVEIDAPGFARRAVYGLPGFGVDSARSMAAQGLEVRRSFVLFPARRVTGVVRDAVTAKPVAGAWVHLAPLGSRLPRRDTSTDREGRFAFDGVDDTRDGEVSCWAVIAGAEGFAVVRKRAVDVGELCPCELRLRKPARVVGRVVDSGGRPVEGAVVRWAAPQPADESWVRVPQRLLPSDGCRTDQDGHYRLDGVPGGEPDAGVFVDTLENEELTENDSVCVGVSPEPGTTIEAADLVVKRSPSVICRVVDARGAALVGARCFWWTRSPSEATSADPSGTCRLFARERDRADGPLRVIASAPGYARGASGFVVPSESDPPQLEIILTPERTVEGKVHYADGSAACDLFVVAGNARLSIDEVFRPSCVPDRNPGREPIPWLDTARTDGRGHFVLRALPPGPVHLEVSLAGTPNRRVVLANAVDDYVRIDAGPRRTVESGPTEADGWIEVSVVDADAESMVADARVRLVDPTTGAARELADLDDGVFVMSTCAPQRCGVRIESARHATQLIRDVTVRSGETTKILVRLEHGLSLETRLACAARRDWSGATVTLLDGEMELISDIPVRADGGVRIKGLPSNKRLTVHVIVDDRVACSSVPGAELCMRPGSPARESGLQVVEVGVLDVNIHGVDGFVWPKGDGHDASGACESTIEIIGPGSFHAVRAGLVSPFQSFLVPLGTAKVRALIPGHAPIERLVQVDQHDDASVDISWE